MAFAGHMIDGRNRETPRFPISAVPSVKKRIQEAVRRHQVGVGYTSLAAGSDVLFAQAILDRGGSLLVYLPFPLERFLQTSATPADDATIRRIHDHPNVRVTVLSPLAPDEAGEPGAFAACWHAIARAAVEHAALLEEDPLLLAVLAPGSPLTLGGTAYAVEGWAREGYAVEIIEPT